MSIKIDVPYSYELYQSMKNDVPDNILIPFLQKLYNMELERDMEHFVKEEEDEEELPKEDMKRHDPITDDYGINYNILDIYNVQSQRETKKENKVSGK